jgi:hypothetical protein
MPQRKTDFQSMEEFLKEQDELDALTLEKTKASSSPTTSSAPCSKKARRSINIEALTSEAKALEEIGDGNWIGRLLGKCIKF